jgi:biotin carboxyl carrier protein
LLREKRVSLCASVLCAITIGFALAAYQSNWSRELAQAALEAPTGSAKPDQMSNPLNSRLRERIPIVIAVAQDVRRRLEFPGVVRAIPTSTVAVLSPVVGRVSGVQIQLGDRVSEKQEIATISVDDNVADQPALQVQNQNGPRRISLRSPIAGSIIDVQTKLGETVQRGSNVASVADLKAIWVALDLSRRDASVIAGNTADCVCGISRSSF